jgi:hypothetical protein
VLLASFVPLPFLSQRFLGFTAVAAAPYLARDLDEWVRARRWPGWTARSWSRAGLAAAACVLCGLPEWSRIEPRLGAGVAWSFYPVAACDFIERTGMRGRGFNEFSLGGYMLYRFWPDRSRLPFMDIHQAGARVDRDAYAFTFSEVQAWRDLDGRHRFDYALLRRMPFPGDHLLEFVDADSSFALVFMDDAAALYARRVGSSRALAERFAYRELPAGSARIGALGAAALADSSRRVRIIAELDREVASSPFHSLALVQRAGLALATGDLHGAEARLRTALAIDSHAARAHERLGWVALASSEPRTALREFGAERRLFGRFRRYDFGVGRAWQALGDLQRARQAYERELQANPGSAEARDSVEALEARLRRGRTSGGTP